MNIKHFVIFGGLITGGIVLLLLPSDYFDSGDTICLSVNLFDTECPGCGITRAIMHLIHFDFAGAYALNKLSFIVLPFLLYFYFLFLFKAYKKITLAKQT